MPIITLLCLVESYLITDRPMNGLREAQKGWGVVSPALRASGKIQRPRNGCEAPTLYLYQHHSVRTTKNVGGLSRKRLPAVVIRLTWEAVTTKGIMRHPQLGQERGGRQNILLSFIPSYTKKTSLQLKHIILPSPQEGQKLGLWLTEYSSETRQK